MYKTKDEEGRKRERKRRSWGSRRSSYRQGIRQRRSKQATVQMELPGKVRDLCQICNWARTVTHSVQTGMCIYSLRLYRQSCSRPRLYLCHYYYIPHLTVVNCFVLSLQISCTKADYALQVLQTLQTMPAPAELSFQSTNQVGKSSSWSTVTCGILVTPVSLLDNPVLSGRHGVVGSW